MLKNHYFFLPILLLSFSLISCQMGDTDELVIPDGTWKLTTTYNNGGKSNGIVYGENILEEMTIKIKDSLYITEKYAFNVEEYTIFPESTTADDLDFRYNDKKNLWEPQGNIVTLEDYTIWNKSFTEEIPENKKQGLVSDLLNLPDNAIFSIKSNEIKITYTDEEFGIRKNLVLEKIS